MEKNGEKREILFKKRGIVVSDKMEKTVVVSVVSFETHTRYGKKYKITRRYKADDPEKKFKIGDLVEIVSCRPVSKEKRFKVIYS
jgi:small subunit ribosomal protein S17